ncbi:MAG: bifunctional precorrin-2 dehydrogenase/sirohydrochlorin ferrochelatase [Methylocystis sp.]
MTRKPDEVSADLMQPLATLPVFYALAGRRVIVVGGGEAAAWKADLAAATGAQVEVFAKDPCDKLCEIARARDSVVIHAREVERGDFAGAAMALGAIEDDALAQRAHEWARAVNVPLNLADRPALSDFTMGAIVNRSPLVIGVSTGGASPVFAQAVRGRIETLVPATFQAWARAAQVWRPLVRASGLDFLARRDFWRRFTRLAFRDIERKPLGEDRVALIEEARAGAEATACGA